MSKIDLSTVESGFLSQAALNSNFTKLETELQNKVLYRDNPIGEPNSMQQDLDMNGHRILNILGEGGDGFIWKRSWGAGLVYEVNNIVYVPSGLYEGYAMICREDHTSSALFQTDYDAGKWEILASRGASGAGSGDLVAANNLSDVASTSAALTNLNGMPKTGGTFTGDIIVPDEAYDASSWDGNNEVPTKNAIRDKLESFSSISVVNSTNDPTFASTSSTESTSPEWVNGRLNKNRFTSASQTITTAGALTIAHGLGSTPKFLSYNLTCTTADAGFSVGDILDINSFFDANSRPTAIWKDATNIYVRFNNNASVFSVAHKTTGALTSLTNSSWNLVINAMI